LRQAASPFIQPLLNAYALPTGPETIVDGEFSGFAPAAYAYSNPSQADTYSIRIDHNLNKKLALFGRFSQTPSQSKTRIVNYLNGQVNNSRSVTLGATYIVSPQVTNEFRFNYSSNRGTSSNTLDTFGGGVPIDVSKIVSGYTGPGTTQASVNLFLPGDEGRLLGYALGNDVDNYQRQFNVVDSISFASGSHLVKAGFDWRRLMPVIGPVNYLQTIYFTNQDEIVNGKASLVAIFARQGSRPIFDNFSSYVQDTWKVSNRLTLDLGLRWELNPAPHDANGVRPVTLTGIQGTDVSKAALAPSGTPIYKTFYTAFAPRIGAAYQLRQKSGRETVLRGGFGVYYDLGNGQSTSGFLGFPFASRNNVFNVELPLTPALARPAGFPPVQLPIENDLYATNPDLKLPYTLQWNIAVQQSLGKNQTVTASYVASAGRRLLVTWTLNQSPQDPVTGDFLPPPNSNFGNILFTDNGPTSDYHSLQLQYQRRLSRGLQAVVNYTWSHAIDEVSNEVIGNYLERGNADFDVRHNLSAAFTYQIPKLNRSDNAFLRSLVNGWSIDGIFFLNSGIPLEVRTNSVVTPDGRFVQGRPDLVLGQPIWIKDSTVAGGERLNPLAFARPPLVNGRLTRRGTLGRNVIFAPGIYQLNMGLSRQFSLGEKPRLQLKADVFNVLNHPMFADRNNFYFPGVTNLGIPNSMLGSGGFAAGYGGLNSLYQLGGPRSIQLSARFSF
jgi:hypothetical protein